MGKFEEKIAVVARGISSIGLAAAETLIVEGAHVFVTGRRNAELDASVANIGRKRAQDASMDTSILQGRPVRESRSEYTYAALANDANPLGNLLGGRVMHLVDMCGWLAAQRHARRPTVTAAIDQMSFMQPVPIGQLVILRSSVNKVFDTSMEVGVKVWVENPQTGELRHTSSAYLTFVAIGEDGKPVSVAPVIAETEEDERRYREAGRRREQRLAARNGLAL